MKKNTQPLTQAQYVWVGVVLFLLFFSLGVLASPITVVDDGGNTLNLNNPPQRVISLLPSLTESVCALGKCNTLVGTDRYSNWPKSIDSLPKLGAIGDFNIERIVQLKPDLVLLEKASPLISRLKSLGIPTLGFDIKSMEDEHRALQKLDLVFDTTQGNRLWDQIQAQIVRANKQLPTSPKNISVYFEVNPAPFAAGRSSFIGELLDRLDLMNIIPASLGPFPKINPEFVVKAKPQVILISETNISQIKKRPGWSTIPAISQNKICTFTPQENDILVRPGPRMGEAALIISECIQKKMSSSEQ